MSQPWQLPPLNQDGPVNVPALAAPNKQNGLPPDTGASISAPPFSLVNLATSMAVGGSIVLESINSVPAEAVLNREIKKCAQYFLGR